jgi:hypothetical protein
MLDSLKSKDGGQSPKFVGGSNSLSKKVPPQLPLTDSISDLVG